MVATVLAVLLAALTLAGTCLAQEAIRLQTHQLRIGIARERGRLVELEEARSPQNLLDQTQAPQDLWELEFQNGGKPGSLSATDAKSFRCDRLAGPQPALRLVWGAFGVPEAPRLRVEAVVHLEQKEPMSRWELTVEGLEELALKRVRFPRVTGLVRHEHECLAVPVWMGQETKRPREVLRGADGKGRRLEWAYPGELSMQCLGFYSGAGPGLYLACNDTAAFRKSFAVFGDGAGNVGCEVVHLPERTAERSGRWSLPYAVLLGTFRGDWMTVAERYRAWGTNQVWAKESRLAQGLVPPWVLQTGLWVWNRGRSPAVLSPALVLQREAGLPVSVFWHWWHGCAYDTGFPQYFPPREGTESFERALAAAQAQGLHALVYMNQRLWGMTTRSWSEEGAECFAVRGADGKIHPEVYNTFTHAPCASMCMGTGFWRDKYASLAVSAVQELGVDGIYMDQACTSLACYATNHGHPPGGGRYWLQGFRQLTDEIRRRCGAPPHAGASSALLVHQQQGPALAGEGCGEPWLPYLDLMLSLQVSRERYTAPDGWDPIPFFPAVYHPYVVTYGNYSSLTMPPYDELWPAQFAPKEPLELLDRKYSRQFRLEQARAFVWGQEPTIANFMPSQLVQRREEVEFVLRLARLRRQASKYLLHGTFLRPPELDAPEATLDMSRLSIYAGRQGGLTTFQKRLPLALASAWRAPDGAVAFALASIADQPLRLSLEVDAAKYHLPDRAGIYRLDERGRTRLGRVRGKRTRLTVELEKAGACVVEFSLERNGLKRDGGGRSGTR